MMISIMEATALLKEKNNILILTHCNPDGDTLGCGYGLCRALQKMGKNARVINSDIISPKFDYMAKDIDIGMFKEEYIVAVDIATTALLGDKLSVYADNIDLCIDHHSSNTEFARNCLVDSNAGAASELIYEIICEMGVSIDKGIANCLYTGLSTDTGCFKYANATSRTYHIGANLIDFGADSAEINRIMFDTKTKSYIRLERAALDSLKLYYNERCAVIKISRSMLEKSGSNESETEALASIPRMIEGVLVGVTIKEKADGSCKASVRSRNGFSACELCKRLGGGGHLQAAACSFETTIDEAEKLILEQIEDMLGAQ